MGEEYRLGRLDVGRPGQDRGPLALGEAHKGCLEGDERLVQAVDGPARPETQVCGDLVVPRTAGLELAGHRAYPFGQRRFEVEVDVLEVRVPRHRPVGDRCGERLQPADELADLVVGQQARPTERADMRDRPGDVVGRQLTVELDRTGELGHPPIVLLREPAAPQTQCTPPRRPVMLAV